MPLKALRLLVIPLICLTVKAVAAPDVSNNSSPQTGRLRLAFSERSPLSDRPVLYKRIGALKPPPELKDGWIEESDLATEVLDVYVSPSYRARTPQGIFVWMGVADASPQWMDVLGRHNLIFFDAKPGNDKV